MEGPCLTFYEQGVQTDAHEESTGAPHPIFSESGTQTGMDEGLLEAPHLASCRLENSSRCMWGQSFVTSWLGESPSSMQGHEG